jgi:hypothetical protein
VAARGAQQQAMSWAHSGVSQTSEILGARVAVEFGVEAADRFDLGG